MNMGKLINEIEGRSVIVIGGAWAFVRNRFDCLELGPSIGVECELFRAPNGAQSVKCKCSE